MMLFLFVLMIVGVDSSDSLIETIRGQRFAAVVVGLGFGILLIAVIGNASVSGMSGLATANQNGNVQGLAALMFTKYVWAFELTSALLITAAVGGMVLAHRERMERKRTQRELAEERLKGGGLVTPLPPSGVYARHNAVDTPALLPDGTPAELSLSRVLQARGDVRTVAAARDHRGPRNRGLPRGHREPIGKGGDTVNPANYLYLSALLFTIGAAGVLLRRNAIVVFMSIELMLNAVNLSFVAFARINGNLDGQVTAFFVMVVAAAEVVVGLSIIVMIFRTRRSASVDDASLLKY